MKRKCINCNAIFIVPNGNESLANKCPNCGFLVQPIGYGIDQFQKKRFNKTYLWMTVLCVGILTVGIVIGLFVSNAKKGKNTTYNKTTEVTSDISVEQTTTEIAVVQTDSEEFIEEDDGQIVEEKSIEAITEEDIISETEGVNKPFYGVWCYGLENETDANDYAVKVSEDGFDAQVFDTTEWSNLNSKRFYVVTAGVYYSESDAKIALENVKKMGYTDAYVKYSGDYIGE